jgi:septal ring factor EnvC (AmiA/AmiB activator)
MTNRLMIRHRTIRSFAALAALGLVPLVMSCSNKATEEQMKTLHGLDQQRDQLKTDLQHAQDNLRDANGKLESANRDLTDCQNNTTAAQAGLALWPNVWPDSVDWRLAPPPAPVEEAPMKHRRHH